MAAREIKVILFPLLVFVLSACSRTISQSENTPTASTSAKPQEGKATVIGRVVNTQSDAPIANTIIRLAEVYRQGGEGAYVLDVAFSPGTISDEQGYFTFENIDPNEYVIVVGDVYDIYEVVVGTDGKPITWNAAVGEVLDVGLLSVDFQP